ANHCAQRSSNNTGNRCLESTLWTRYSHHETVCDQCGRDERAADRNTCATLLTLLPSRCAAELSARFLFLGADGKDAIANVFVCKYLCSELAQSSYCRVNQRDSRGDDDE